MKIQIKFEYKGTKYQYTIDENNVDMTHYDTLWDWWCGENDNELIGKGYIDKEEDEELIFEITADKLFLNDDVAIINGDGLYVNVYPNTFEDHYEYMIDTKEIEILYA